MRAVYQQQVRFEHCDPAGIVFYPRYIEMLQEVLEAWGAEYGETFAAGAQLALTQLRARFLRPSHLGDTLSFSLQVQAQSATQLAMDCRVLCGEEKRVELELRLGCLRRGDVLEWAELPRPQHGGAG